MLKLYCAPMTISTAVVVALNEGVHWEPIRVDVKGGEQTREPYLSLNPKGRVPVLLTPEGALTETGAILEYLGETVLPDLVPLDPLHRARMREVIHYIASTAHVAHAHMRRGYRWADQESSFEDMRAKATGNMAASAAYLDDLIVGPLIFGEAMTLADAHLYTITTWLGPDGVEIADYPKLAAFKTAMEARASVRKARADGYFS